jgi:signal transduction histidine kinase
MNLNNWEQLRDCCRDEMAFARLQQLLSIAEQPPTLERHHALWRVISKIRESLDLTTIFKTTAADVRQLLKADRVGIFRFEPNSNWTDGEFVSEDVAPAFHSALDAQVHDHCFGAQYATHYQSGRVQAVADIYQAGFQDCHLQILRQFQVRANLVVPLLQGSHLWGLLCIHQCVAPREWQADEIEFVTQLANHLGIALQQAELLQTTQQQAIKLTQALDQLKKNQAQLIQHEKLASLGQLLAGVAHEINNPVNFIYGNLSHACRYANDLLALLSDYRQEHKHLSHKLADRVSDVDLDFLTEDFPKILSSMQVGADRIRQIVLSLRNFARTDESEWRTVNIHDGLDSTLLILQHRFKPKANLTGIRLIKNYGELPLVECYASQLNQVFMNILSNALDALQNQVTDAAERSSNQQIIIRTGVIPDPLTGIDRVIIRIADNGPGIAPALQSKIFEPFVTTKPANQGTGLGLSISRQIVVDRHGGSLECYSQLGEGTEFWIEIPVRQGVQQEGAAGRTMEAWTFD